MIRVGMVGLGKMGLSHVAIVRAHPEVELVAGCDTMGYLTDVLSKHTGLKCYADMDAMLASEQLDAVVISTPSRLHATMVGKALERGLHVFCEKPFVLDVHDGERLAEQAAASNLVTQVGYHYRFVGAFQEAARVVRSGALGTVHHVRAEAYGPVVLRPKGGTWRTAKTEGGGALYDYACHAIDTVNFVAGAPASVSGVVSQGIFSRDVEDEIYCTLHFPGGAQWPVVRELERREPAQDEHQNHGVGYQWPRHRRPPGMPDLSARTARHIARYGARLDRALHHGSDQRGVVLPARRGVLGTDRLLCAEHQGRPHRRREQLQLGAADRPRGGDDPGRKQRRPPGSGAATRTGGRCIELEALAGPPLPMNSAGKMNPSTHAMDRVLFGDNQFFGVNHMSEEKARSQQMRFQDLQAIIDVLDVAYAEGIRTFMCTTYDRVGLICDHFRAHPEKYPDYRFYPCMPYAHKYANAVTEHGMIDALRMFLPQDGAMSAMLKGGMALANKDVAAIMRLLIDAEMKMFHGLQTPVIFMQNVITDLLIGLRFDGCLRYFHDHVRERYGAEPGYITMNLPKLLDVLDRQGIVNPIVCANVNKIGFRMCGGIELYEQAIASRSFVP